MRLTCPSCETTYEVPAGQIPEAGRHVQCSSCHTRWFVRPSLEEAPSEEQIIYRLEHRGPTRPRPAERAPAEGATPAPQASAGRAGSVRAPEQAPSAEPTTWRAHVPAAETAFDFVWETATPGRDAPAEPLLRPVPDLARAPRPPEPARPVPIPVPREAFLDPLRPAPKDPPSPLPRSPITPPPGPPEPAITAPAGVAPDPGGPPGASASRPPLPEPVPPEPEPQEPQPVEPAPVEPAPVEPTPVRALPAEPAITEPVVEAPTPIAPAAAAPDHAEAEIAEPGPEAVPGPEALPAPAADTDAPPEAADDAEDARPEPVEVAREVARPSTLGALRPAVAPPPRPAEVPLPRSLGPGPGALATPLDRPAGRLLRGDPSPDTRPAPPPPPPEPLPDRNRFGRGFLVALLLFAAAFLLYVYGEALAALAPALAPTLQNYLDAVNGLREAIAPGPAAR